MEYFSFIEIIRHQNFGHNLEIINQEATLKWTWCNTPSLHRIPHQCQMINTISAEF